MWINMASDINGPGNFCLFGVNSNMCFGLTQEPTSSGTWGGCKAWPCQYHPFFVQQGVWAGDGAIYSSNVQTVLNQCFIYPYTWTHVAFVKETTNDNLWAIVDGYPCFIWHNQIGGFPDGSSVRIGQSSTPSIQWEDVSYLNAPIVTDAQLVTAASTPGTRVFTPPPRSGRGASSTPVSVNQFTPIYQKLSPTARASMVTMLSLRDIGAGYLGPVLTLRRSTDGAVSNFYFDTSGLAIGTAAGGKGTSLASWLRIGTNQNATAYVTTWYDQSGRGNHATQTVTSLQPVYNSAKGVIDLSNGAFFNMPDFVPLGNSKFTITFRHGVIAGTVYPTVLVQGGAPNDGMSFIAAFPSSSAAYAFQGYNHDLSPVGSYASGNTVSVIYDQSSLFRIVNSVTVDTTPYANHDTQSGGGAIGSCLPGPVNSLNGELFFVYIFSDVISTTDRITLEQQG